MVHDKLFKSDLKYSSVAKILRDFQVPTTYRKNALNQVEKDLALAKSIGINETPSLLLCTPDGKVRHLENIEELSMLYRY